MVQHLAGATMQVENLANPVITKTLSTTPIVQLTHHIQQFIYHCLFHSNVNGQLIDLGHYPNKSIRRNGEKQF